MQRALGASDLLVGVARHRIVDIDHAPQLRTTFALLATMSKASERVWALMMLVDEMTAWESFETEETRAGRPFQVQPDPFAAATISSSAGM